MNQARPKGILVPIGGSEDTEVLCRVLDETRKKNPFIEIISIASIEPEETGRDYRIAFDDLDVGDVGDICIRDRKEVPDFIDRIKKCDAVFFSGGNQLRLTTLLGGTDFIDILKKRYYTDENFVIAGTSAGAAAMSDTMIVSGSGPTALIKGELQLNNGLAFITNVFIDTHFTERGRFGRLIQTVTSNPAVLGLGLGEDTGAVIYNGNELEIIGSGLAVITDGLTIKYTDITEIAQGEPITVEGISIHVLGKGKIFSLTERRLLKS